MKAVQLVESLRACSPAAALAAMVVVALTLVGCAPHTVRGSVSSDGAPVAGAVVRLRATNHSTLTDARGAYTLAIPVSQPHQVVTAWAEGYYPAGADLSTVARSPEGDAVADLTLKPHPTADDPSYAWLTSLPDPEVSLGCGHCMTTYNDWRLDAHALSASNPRFFSVYNGTDVSGNPSAGPGFRLDSPSDPGNCANCHAPAAALARPGRADMNALTGVEREGVLCDLCHKVGGVTLDPATRLPYAVAAGVASYQFYRPAPGTQIFFGTLDDIPRRVTPLELERKSEFCAPCHSGGWWGVSAYASYDEWLASPYAAEGMQCQDCHMPSDGVTTRITSACAPPTAPSASAELACRVQGCVDCHLRPANPAASNPLAAASLVPERANRTIRSHRMTGVRDKAFMRSAVTTMITATQGAGGIIVDVSITNSGTGHHVPSDSPLRNMILLVKARDAQGRELAYLGGQVVPKWGGEGPVEQGNYAGQPGKGFAKVLEDYEGNSPAPQWRNGIHILSDNRIAARAADSSRYPFAAPPDGGLVTAEATLIFRRAFKPWADAKEWNDPDLVMAEITATAKLVEAATPMDEPSAPATEKLFAPAEAQTADGERLDSSAFPPPASCAACHEVASRSWQGSGHAAAATSPLFRAWFKAAGQTTGGQISAYCAGCHTPVGLLSGQVRSRWTWGGRQAYPLDATAQGGVSCAVCHAVDRTTGPGNGAYVLDGKAALCLASAHGAQGCAGAAREGGATFCAGCHEATNPATGLPVMTTFSEWRRSPFNTGDPITTVTCWDCHFADGRHGALRPEDLKGAARVELILPDRVPDRDELLLQVRVSNIGAGHDLPTGAAELRQMWLEASVTDAAGREIYRSGATDEYGDPAEGTVTYGTRWRDAAGNPTDRLWEAAAPLADHRVPAGSSVVESYRVPLPPGTQGPLRVRATLNSRAASGYLSSLMTIYLGDQVSLSPVVEMAATEADLQP